MGVVKTKDPQTVELNNYTDQRITSEASAMKRLLTLLQTSRSSSLDDGKIIFFWQQRIKLA